MDATIDQEALDLEDRGLPWAQDPNIPDDTIDLWRRAPNWYTITELNRRFLEGRLVVCPSYSEPVAAETERFSRLMELHDYGVNSTQSCPGEFSPDKLERRRSFLYFSIPSNGVSTASPHALLKFIQALLASPEIYTHIRFQYYYAFNPVGRDPAIRRLLRFGSCSNLPQPGDRVWEEERWKYAFERRGDDVKAVYFLHGQYRGHTQGDRWDDGAWYWVRTGHSSFGDDQRPFPASYQADPLQISVVARDWKFHQIGDLILRLLIESGIQPAFRR